jgi:hypothetical protein
MYIVLLMEGLLAYVRPFHDQDKPSQTGPQNLEGAVLTVHISRLVVCPRHARIILEAVPPRLKAKMRSRLVRGGNAVRAQ